MKRLVTPVLVVALSGFAMPAVATEHVVEVEATQLLSDPDEWDGRLVAVTGELVGDYSPRHDGVWVQLNDDSFVDSPIGAGGTPDTTNTGIGARIPTDGFDRVDGPPGRYGRSGPIVRLEGIYRHSDADLQGESYLAVETATTITPAQEHPAPGPDVWLPIGLVLLSIAGVVLYAGRRDRRHPKPTDETHSLDG